MTSVIKIIIVIMNNSTIDFVIVTPAFDMGQALALGYQLVLYTTTLPVYVALMV